MIFTGIINAIYYLLYAVTYPIRLLPDVDLSGGFGSAMQTVGGYLSSLNDILPIDVILSLLGIYVTIETAYLSYKLIMWLIKRFPTQS